MRKLKPDNTEFLSSINSQILELSENAFINNLPQLFEQYFPFSETIVYYKDLFSDKFLPYSYSKSVKPLPVINGNALIIKALSDMKKDNHFLKEGDPFFEIFENGMKIILKEKNINLIIPLRLKNFIKGMLLTTFEKKNHRYLNQIAQDISLGSSHFVAQIEIERNKIINDRDYYKLFKFDRLVLLGEMVASIAHEMRTPLNTILFRTDEIFKSATIDKKSSKNLIIINQEIKRINEFIKSLLQFSKFQKIKIETFNLTQYIKDILKSIPRKRIPPTLKIDTELEPMITIKSDKNRLRQVILNILFNAFDVVGPNGEVTVKTYKESKKINQTEKVIISIKDNGGGIKEEIKGKIFQPFFTTKENGTGLGLYISHGIMKSLDGDLDLHNSDTGTIVRLILEGN